MIASHSSAFALADHPRNVPDDVLKLVAKNGGVVMVNFYSGFIVARGGPARRRRCFEVVPRAEGEVPRRRGEFETALRAWRRRTRSRAASVHDVVDHIEHIIKVAGIDHVGLGSDFDGINSVPQQLEDVSCYPFITQELLEPRLQEGAIHKILGGNLLRVFRRPRNAESNRSIRRLRGSADKTEENSNHSSVLSVQSA